jgi:spermidine synthase/MFS family permease
MVRWSTRLAYPVVFLSGFVFLLLEITAGRLLAPAIGFSLETWTGIIGVVLAGQAIGDAIGGRLIDRYPRPRLLAGALITGGVAVLLMPMLSVAARGMLPSAPIMVRVIATSAIVLLVPSLLLASVSPIASRLTLRAVDNAGRTIGRLSAVSTVGSVLGVVIGGFVLLQEFGVRAIVLSSGGLLLLLGVLVAVVADDAEARSGAVEDVAPTTGVLLDGVAWGLYLLPFVAGGAIMAAELAAARLAATLFGTSLYTWASTIGTVLLGISVGTALGGWLADRYPTRSFAAGVLVVGAAATVSLLGVMYLYTTVAPAAALRVMTAIRPSVSLPLLFGGLLLPMSVAFGAVTPVAIRLLVRHVSSSGGVVGRAYAAQALGSIAGTFATGFVLVSHFGARAVILMVAAGTLAIAAWVADPIRLPTAIAVRAITAALLVATLGISVTGRVPSPCNRESNYYCIRVRRQDADVRTLSLDNLVHTYINLKEPTRLLYEYEQVFGMTAAELTALRNRPPRVLLIGGGGYAFPRYLTQVYPGSTMHVVEIDPIVTRTVYEDLGLSREAPVRTWNEDGRQFLMRDRVERYDLILGDAFRDAYSVPYHLTTREFAAMASASLEPGGVFAANVIDGKSALFLRSYLRTLREVFRHVYLVPVDAKWRENPQITSVILASNDAIDTGSLTSRRPEGVPAESKIFALSNGELDAFLAEGGGMVLTDDHAPVENLLARLFAESVKRRR